MTTVILNYYSATSEFGDFKWRYRPVKLVKQTNTYWRIWSWHEPFTRVIAKGAKREKVTA